MLAHTAQQHKPQVACSVEWLLPQAQASLAAMAQSLHQAALAGTAAHEVERSLFQQLLQLGYLLFGSFLTFIGPGDLGETATLDDGRAVRRLDELHARGLLTVFGGWNLSHA
jgi:hypothetical protein